MPAAALVLTRVYIIVPDMVAMSANDWDDYHESIVTPNEDPDRDFGAYAIAARRRRHGVCPFGKTMATS